MVVSPGEFTEVVPELGVVADQIYYHRRIFREDKVGMSLIERILATGVEKELRIPDGRRKWLFPRTAKCSITGARLRTREMRSTRSI
jgi:hypothetical protein